MNSDLSLEFLRVVEQAAIACAHTMGQGDRHKSDQVAVEAMRKCLDTVPIDGTIVIGEGERDEAPMLFIGEKVGTGRSATAGLGPAAGGHRRRSARGHEPLRDRRAERDRRAGGLRSRRPAARARSLHGEARRRSELEARGQPRRAGRREPAGDRPVPRARRRGPRRHRARPAAARGPHRARSARPAPASG